MGRFLFVFGVLLVAFGGIEFFGGLFAHAPDHGTDAYKAGYRMGPVIIGAVLLLLGFKAIRSGRRRIAAKKIDPGVFS